MGPVSCTTERVRQSVGRFTRHNFGHVSAAPSKFKKLLTSPGSQLLLTVMLVFVAVTSFFTPWTSIYYQRPDQGHFYLPQYEGGCVNN
jgi:hypothetical protein